MQCDCTRANSPLKLRKKENYLALVSHHLALDRGVFQVVIEIQNNSTRPWCCIANNTISRDGLRSRIVCWSTPFRRARDKEGSILHHDAAPLSAQRLTWRNWRAQTAQSSNKYIFHRIRLFVVSLVIHETDSQNVEERPCKAIC